MSLPLYHIPANLQSGVIKGRHYISTSQGGKIIVDEKVVSIWRAAEGHTINETINLLVDQFYTDEIRSTLACMVEAKVLMRGEGEKRAQSVSLSATGKMVSAVVVAYNGREWLPECLTSLFSQTYSPVEIIVVDNCSTDGTADWLEEKFPQVKLLRLGRGYSLAKAINFGIDSASGDYFLVLNQDISLDANVIVEMVSVVQRDITCGAVAAKLKFMWAPSFLNGIGNRVVDYSWGSDIGLGILDLGQFDNWREVPSACFAAALIPRWVWSEVGPVDAGFPLYYEDCEWCYRTRLLGYKIMAAPRAVVYHAFGGKIPTGEQGGITARKQRLVSYGRYRFAIKIVGSNQIPHFLRNYWLEDWANCSAALIKGHWGIAFAYLQAWVNVLVNLPKILRLRRLLQSRRQITDNLLFATPEEMPETLEWNGLPVLTLDAISKYYQPLFRLDRIRVMPEFEISKGPVRLLIVGSEAINGSSSKIAARYLEITKALSADIEVTLVVPDPTTLQAPNLRLVLIRKDHPVGLQVLVENHDIALVSGDMINKFSFLETTKTRLIVDLSNSLQLESLIGEDEDSKFDSRCDYAAKVEIINSLARSGDFYICENESQRDRWLGVLAANCRANSINLAQDASLRSLIDVIGLGSVESAAQIEPLRRYCLKGGYAPDRKDRDSSKQSIQSQPQSDNVLPKGKIEEAYYIWRTRGFLAMLKQVQIHLRWIILHR